jgi:hypothetical protein
LVEHPQDTIRVLFDEPQPMTASTSGVIQGKHVANGDTLFLAGYDIVAMEVAGQVKAARSPRYVQTVILSSGTIDVVDYETADKLDQKAVETRFEYDITDGHRRDVKGYQLKNRINSPDGKAIKRAADKDGWGIQLEGSYQLASGMNAFTGRGGLSYTGTFWKVDVLGGATRTIYSENADHAGDKYWAFGSEAGLWLQPFKFDQYDCNRFYFGGGAGFEWYSTDSRQADGYSYLQSEGNYIYPHLGVEFEHRFFSTGNSLYLKAQWRQKKLIIQNDDRKVENCFEFTIGFNWGLMRNKNSH